MDHKVYHSIVRLPNFYYAIKKEKIGKLTKVFAVTF